MANTTMALEGTLSLSLCIVYFSSCSDVNLNCFCIILARIAFWIEEKCSLSEAIVSIFYSGYRTSCFVTMADSTMALEGMLSSSLCIVYFSSRSNVNLKCFCVCQAE